MMLGPTSASALTKRLNGRPCRLSGETRQRQCVFQSVGGLIVAVRCRRQVRVCGWRRVLVVVVFLDLGRQVELRLVVSEEFHTKLDELADTNSSIVHRHYDGLVTLLQVARPSPVAG